MPTNQATNQATHCFVTPVPAEVPQPPLRFLGQSSGTRGCSHVLLCGPAVATTVERGGRFKVSGTGALPYPQPPQTLPLAADLLSTLPPRQGACASKLVYHQRPHRCRCYRQVWRRVAYWQLQLHHPLHHCMPARPPQSAAPTTHSMQRGLTATRHKTVLLGRPQQQSHTKPSYLGARATSFLLPVPAPATLASVTLAAHAPMPGTGSRWCLQARLQVCSVQGTGNAMSL